MDSKDRINSEVSSDEKLLGMLAHLSIFLGGIILPIILWATQKDKSQFVRFHSLQAIFYHIAYGVVMVLYVILMLIVMLVFGFGFGIFKTAHHGSEPGAGFFIMMIAFYIGLFGVIFFGIGYAIYLGVKTYKGKLIKVLFIGNIIYEKVYGKSGAAPIQS